MGQRITAAYPIAKAGGIPINTSIPASKETYDRLGGRDVAFVVLHYTGNVSDTAKANCKYFAGGDREASAHYFVDEDSIYQSVPACDRAWAVGSPAPVHPLCRNTNSISIEMCCSGNYHVSERTKANAAARRRSCVAAGHLRCGHLRPAALRRDREVLPPADGREEQCGVGGVQGQRQGAAG